MDKLQPLDILFNRQMKSIFRYMYGCIHLDQSPISMSETNNIIKLVSLCYSQVSSQLFHGLVEYAWYACGYSMTDLGPFPTVEDVCFTFIVKFLIAFVFHFPRAHGVDAFFNSITSLQNIIFIHL